MAIENTKTFLHNGVKGESVPLSEPEDNEVEVETPTPKSKAAVSERYYIDALAADDEATRTNSEAIGTAFEAIALKYDNSPTTFELPE